MIGDLVLDAELAKAQIEHAIDLADQMVGRHHLVEIKRIEELALSVLSPPHHEPFPPMYASINGITARESSQWEFCNRIPPIAASSIGGTVRRNSGHDRPSASAATRRPGELFLPLGEPISIKAEHNEPDGR
jgi:hypothetical protein